MEGLLYIAKQLPSLLFFYSSGSSAIYQYTALLWLIQSKQQLEDRTFPCSGSAVGTASALAIWKGIRTVNTEPLLTSLSTSMVACI